MEQRNDINSGWIPVSEYLPEEPKCMDLPDLEDIGEYVEYIVMIEGAKEATTLIYVGDGEWCDEMTFYKVIAWMPLPKPYVVPVLSD